MKNAAIGVFDSGLGGLTAVKELVKILPHEDVVYFGDTGRVPYGTRSRDTIISYARQDLRFLSTFDIKIALVACGTISAVALDVLKGEHSFPVVGVIESAARAAAARTKNKRIGIIGTGATVKSGAYAKMLAAIDPEIETVSVPCPLFVPLVEEGWIAADDPVTRQVAARYLEPIIEGKVDTLIMGCTHYPVLRSVLAYILGDAVALIDPGTATALQVKAQLAAMDALSDSGGSCRYYVSDRPDAFSRIAQILLGEEIRDAVQEIDINRYSTQEQL